MKKEFDVFNEIFAYIAAFSRTLYSIVFRIIIIFSKEAYITIKYFCIGIYNTSICISKFTFKELSLLARAIHIGGKRVLKISLYELPIFIVRSFSDFFDLIAKKINLLIKNN